MKKLPILVMAFFLLFLSASQAKLTIYAKSSLGPREPFRVFVEASYEEAKDIYVALYNSSRGLLLFIAPDGLITRTPRSYATSVRSLNETVLDLTLEQVTPELIGEWYVLAAAVPSGQSVYSIHYTPETFQAVRVRVRQAPERNTVYLSRYLQELQAGTISYLAGVYNDRLLSVYHPEVYLQADDLFLRFLSLVEGSAWFYDTPPDQISSLYDFLPREGKPSFSMDMVDLSLYEAVDEYEVYPEPVPYLNWFDRRVMPIHFILKAQKRFGLNVTPIEKAFLVYFRHKYVDKSNPDRLFIAYSLDGSAYIIDSDKVYDFNGKETSHITKPVVLVFNERSAFFPLMSRDDRDKDPNLAKAVSLIGADEDPIPILGLLSDFERQAIEVLKETTGHLTDIKKEIVRVAASNIEYLFVQRLYEEGIFSQADPIPGKTYEATLFHFRTIGSSLSPFSDHLAQILKRDGYQTMSEEFLKFNQWGGETVSVESVSYTIDIGFRADVGSCKDLSTYAAAALEVAGKDWYRLRGIVYDGTITAAHFYVYVPDDEAFMDNGHYIDGSLYGYRFALGGVPNAGLPFLTNFSFDRLETPDGFAFFWLADDTMPSGAYGDYSLSKFQSLMQLIYQQANPKPVFNIFTYYDGDSTFTKVIATIPFEEGLARILEMYQRYVWE